MKSILVALLLFACGSIRAQNVVWEQLVGASLGARQGVDVMPAPDGGFIAVGQVGAGSRTLAVVYLVRTTSRGEIIWEKTLPGNESTLATALFPAGDGTFYILGSVRHGDVPGDTIWRPWIAKVDTEGSVLWAKTRGTGRVNGADRTADGGFVLTGMNDAAVLLVKLDNSGELVWEHSFHHGLQATGASVRQTNDGGYIVVGSTSDSPASDNTDVLLVRADGAGDSLWAGAYMEQLVGREEGYCVEEVAGGGFVFAGVERTSDFTNLFGRLFLAGVGAQGEVRWMRSLPLYVFRNDSLGINDPYMSRKLDDGGLVISGASGPDYTVPFLLRLGADGTVEWQKVLGDLIFSASVATSFRPLPDGGFIVTGAKARSMLLTRIGRPTSGVDEGARLPDRMNLSYDEGMMIDR